MRLWLQKNIARANAEHRPDRPREMRGVGEASGVRCFGDRGASDQAFKRCREAAPQDEALKGHTYLGGEEVTEPSDRESGGPANIGEAKRPDGKEAFDLVDSAGNTRIDGSARPTFGPIAPERQRAAARYDSGVICGDSIPQYLRRSKHRRWLDIADFGLVSGQ